MIARKAGTVRPAMVQARRRFERWRKTRPTSSPTSPIPEALWALAVKVASAHGINKTAQALRLNYNALKQRVNAADGSARGRPRSATFVELPSSPGFSLCTIELENAQGAKLKIHLPHLETADLLALSRSLWKEEG
jgi:hypothetical protein